MRTCARCKKQKPLPEFYRNTARKSGRCSWCKLCHRFTKRRRTFPFGTKEYWRRYGQAQVERIRKWRQDNPGAYRAHRAVHNAIQRGELKRPRICPKCRKRKPVQAHHQDYRRPLHIHWRCRHCHAKEHWKNFK